MLHNLYPLIRQTLTDLFCPPSPPLPPTRTRRINISLFAVGLAMYIRGLLLVYRSPLMWTAASFRHGSYERLAHLAFFFEFNNQLVALNVILCTFRLIDYTSISHTLGLLLRTFFGSIPKLMTMIGFLVVLALGYAVAFFVVFGSRVKCVRYIGSAFMYVSVSSSPIPHPCALHGFTVIDYFLTY